MSIDYKEYVVECDGDYGGIDKLIHEDCPVTRTYSPIDIPYHPSISELIKAADQHHERNHED